VEDTFGASERLRSMGAVRYVGASFHDHALAERWINRPELDVAMVRHNIAHRGAQDRVFAPAIQGGPMRPGIVTFKSQEAEGPLAKDRALPAGCVVPDAGDRYRYSLSQPAVDVCLTGPRTRSDIDGALHAVTRGYLTRDEMTVLERYGDHAHA
jgi:predicted aldo/keto reductase-like oxidoreductase